MTDWPSPLVLSPTFRFNISFFPPSTLVIDLHYQCYMFLSFALYRLLEISSLLHYGGGEVYSRGGGNIFQFFSHSTHLLVNTLITGKIEKIYISSSSSSSSSMGHKPVYMCPMHILSFVSTCPGLTPFYSRSEFSPGTSPQFIGPLFF